ncbi:glucosaminidase domain-containing protein [Variovorax sp. AFSI2.2]|uniref:glucosaminidase domain-containing protein n=1 Tax=Variovorax sp. AFSI2.2 TaxID=3384160 RepID=UPI003EBED95B
MSDKDRLAVATPAQQNGKEQFIADLYPAAAKVSQQTGMSKELILAQAALETGWGEKVLSGTNNIFNIKASPDWRGPTKTFAVPEFLDGKKVMVNAEFRVYASTEDALNDRVKFLQENSRYTKSGLFDPGTKGNLEKEAAALQKAGYATDPHYAKQLAAVYHGPTMQRAVKAAAMSSLTEEGHPGNALYKQALAGLEKWNREHDIPSDQGTKNAAAAIATEAQHRGLKRIDDIAPNDSGAKFIAIQGRPGTAHSKVIDVDTMVALNTPLAQSSQAFADAHNQQQNLRSQQMNQPAQTQTSPVLH